jgi:hypothetical protein
MIGKAYGHTATTTLGCLVTRTIFIFCLLFGATTVAAQSLEYKSVDDVALQTEIGIRLFNQPTDGCWSCHGTDANSLKSRAGDNKAIRLSDPSTWRSYQIAPTFDSDTGLSQRQIAVSLIRLGADEWNRQVAPLIRSQTGSNEIFFDERMIGIHSGYLKKNQRAIARILKRAKIRASREDVLDIMATSVFAYLANDLLTEIPKK